MSSDSSDSFYVVVTEEWAAAVPSTWVFPDIMMVWWPKGETITLAVSKKREPEGSWNETTYQYLLGPFDTYIEARRNEKRAIHISTDDDTEALLSKFPSDGSKRKKKNNRQDDFLYSSDLAPKNLNRNKITPKEAAIFKHESKLSSNDDNDDDNSDDDDAARRPQVKSSAVLKPLPECPIMEVGCFGDSTNVQSTELQAGTWSSLSSVQHHSQIDACTSDPLLSPLHHPKRKRPNSVINDPFGTSSSTAAEFSLPNSCIEDVSKDVSRRHSNFCCAACRQENALQLKKISRQLHGIALLLQNDQVPVNAKGAADKKIPHVAELPVQTLLQFTEFEKKLKEDIQLRHDFEGMVLRFGGETAIKHLRNVLKYTFSTAMRNTLCWSGQKGRVGVKTSLTTKVILENVSKKFPNSTVRELEVSFQEWLRRGGDQIRSIQKSASRL